MAAMVEVNGRAYCWPARPLAVVCIDGSEPAYIEQAVAAGVMPFTAGMLAEGADLRADAVMPTFTNPNNLSIVTGRPPSVHGISGNFFHDPVSGRDVMMNDPRFLRAPTILRAFAEAGARVAVVTAKDKLRTLLGHGLDFGTGRAICFSAECAASASLTGNGIEGVPAMVGLAPPPVYSAGLSEFVFAAGLRLMERMRPDLLYLSTTDYVQHKCAPGSAGANAFYAMMDRYWAALDALGVTLVLTADHGMNAKHDDAGGPDVLYLQDVLERLPGGGGARVILPITDPYVVHHGALGSCAMVYLPGSGPADIAGLAGEIAALDGVEQALPRTAAAAAFELPADRLGDIMVVGGRRKVIGASAGGHDLSGLDAPLRSHGGLAEQRVPMICNTGIDGLPAGHRLRNFDAFWLGLNLARTNGPASGGR